MYKLARAQQEVSNARQLALGLTDTSESLAGRGIYRSPISEYSLGQTRKTYATALSDALAELAQQEIGMKAQLSGGAKMSNMAAINEYNRAKDAQSAANRAALSQGAYSMGANLLARRFAPKAPSVYATQQAPNVIGSQMSSQLNTDWSNELSRRLSRVPANVDTKSSPWNWK